MNSKILFFALFSFLLIDSFAQSPEQRKVREETLEKVTKVIINGSPLEIKQELEFWQQKSPMNEELFRVKLWLDLSQGEFDEANYDENIIGYLLAFDRLESQSFTPHYHAPSYHASDELTLQFDKMMLGLFSQLKFDEDDQLEKALVNHYSRKEKIWEALENHELNETKIQEYYDEIAGTKKYTSDALTVQGGINSILINDEIKLGSHLGLGYAWLEDKHMIRATFGFRFLSALDMEYIVNGREVEVKDVNFQFLNFSYGHRINQTRFDGIFLISDLSFRTQQITYVSALTSLGEPIYNVTMQGNGYIAPGLAVLKKFNGSFLIFEVKYLTSINKKLADSQSADQLDISLVYGLHFREGIKKSHFK